MDNYEKAFYAQNSDDNRSQIRSALDFVLWVNEVDPQEADMAAVFQSLPETERQRMKNAVKHIKSLTQGNQKND